MEESDSFIEQLEAELDTVALKLENDSTPNTATRSRSYSQQSSGSGEHTRKYVRQMVEQQARVRRNQHEDELQDMESSGSGGWSGSGTGVSDTGTPSGTGVTRVRGSTPRTRSKRSGLHANAGYGSLSRRAYTLRTSTSTGALVQDGRVSPQWSLSEVSDTSPQGELVHGNRLTDGILLGTPTGASVGFGSAGEAGVMGGGTRSKATSEIMYQFNLENYQRLKVLEEDLMAKEMQIQSRMMTARQLEESTVGIVHRETEELNRRREHLHTWEQRLLALATSVEQQEEYLASLSTISEGSNDSESHGASQQTSVTSATPTTSTSTSTSTTSTTRSLGRFREGSSDLRSLSQKHGYDMAQLNQLVRATRYTQEEYDVLQSVLAIALDNADSSGQQDGVQKNRNRGGNNSTGSTTTTTTPHRHTQTSNLTNTNSTRTSSISTATVPATDYYTHSDVFASQRAGHGQESDGGAGAGGERGEDSGRQQASALAAVGSGNRRHSMRSFATPPRPARRAPPPPRASSSASDNTGPSRGSSAEEESGREISSPQESRSGMHSATSPPHPRVMMLATIPPPAFSTTLMGGSEGR